MRALVTGGGGFIGRRIVELLRERGDQVSVLSRQPHPDVEAAGATSVTADVRDAVAVRAAMAGVDVVFHVAGKVGTWGKREDFFSVNVDGTRIVLEAARRCGVRRLVFTSTPSVVGYATDIENGDRELPYSTHHESHYPESKAEAERLVLSANGDQIATVAVRPHLVIGPRDTQTMPRVLDRAARGLLRIIGDGRNRVDLTYVDNAAWAHLDAAAALEDHQARCGGRAYFITNHEPVVLWEWLNGLFRDLDLPQVQSHISFAAARAAGAAMETVWSMFPMPGEPPVTRFLASALARCHWYDSGPAVRDLGYQPRVSMKEAKREIVAWLRGTGPSVAPRTR